MPPITVRQHKLLPGDEATADEGPDGVDHILVSGTGMGGKKSDFVSPEINCRGQVGFIGLVPIQLEISHMRQSGKEVNTGAEHILVAVGNKFLQMMPSQIREPVTRPKYREQFLGQQGGGLGGNIAERGRIQHDEFRSDDRHTLVRLENTATGRTSQHRKWSSIGR